MNTLQHVGAFVLQLPSESVLEGKPLFYAFHNDTLYLASEAKALFAAGVPANWDAESVYHCVEYGGHPVRTLFDGVFQVPPGYYLIATAKHIQLHRYWDFNYPVVDRAASPRSDAEYAAEFRDALEEALRIRLRGFQALLNEIDVRGQLAGRHPLHQSLYMWSKTLLPGYILTMLGDGMEMAHSVEGRVPFLDHHVVEVLRSQPVKRKGPAV